MKKIKGVLIDVDNKKVSVEEIDDDFRAIQKIIKAYHINNINIARRQVGPGVYAIIYDVMGPLNPDAYKRISAMRLDGSDMRVGNLFICKENRLELGSLTESQIEQVKLAIRKNSYDDSPILILG